MIIGYNLTEWETYRQQIPVESQLKKLPHLLLTGKSGSGKSQSFLWYAYHILRDGESLLFLADFKQGQEYKGLAGSLSYAYADDAVTMILDYYKLYTSMRKASHLSIPHVTLVIEEWFGLLGYIESQDKKLKTELMSKVGEILALGRGIGNGIGIFLMVQRADSSNFSAGSREQFQNIVSYGRLSKEQKAMLFTDSEIFNDGIRNYKPGQGVALIDGQGDAVEIIVPWVPEQDRMLQKIREYMDNQPSIQELIQQTGATEGVAEQKP